MCKSWRIILGLVLTLTMGIAMISMAASSPKPITFSLFFSDSNTNDEKWQSPVAKKITEITGVKLDISYPVGDLNQKVALMVASGDFTDFIQIKDAGVTQCVDAGAMIDLRPYIEKYGKNIKRIYGKYLNRMSYSATNRGIYVLTASVDGSFLDAGGPVWLQHAVVKEAGYPQMRTLQAFEDAIKAYYAKHPTIDGQPTIPLSINGGCGSTEDWRFQCSVTDQFKAMVGTNTYDGEWTIDPKTLAGKLNIMQPIAKEPYRWLNHMNAIGLLDPESFTQTYDQYAAKMASGRVLGAIDTDWSLEQSRQTLRGQGREERTFGRFPVCLNDKYYPKLGTMQQSSWWPGAGIGITKKCKDPVRAFKFLDWICSDEGQILLRWGIKGVNYNIVNGKRVQTEAAINGYKNDPAWQQKTGIGVYDWNFPGWGNFTKDASGQYWNPRTTPDFVIANYSNADKETLMHYNAKMWSDLFPKNIPQKMTRDAWTLNVTDDFSTTFNKYKEIARRAIAEAVLCKPADFDSVWNKFMKDLEANGVRKMEADFSKAYKADSKLW